MADYYNMDGVKTALIKDLAKARAFRDAWKNVSFNTKKDGTPFVNMQKNINGAKYTRVSYAMQEGENELIVYTSAENCGYIHESINCYNLVKYLNDAEQIAKTENYMPKSQYLEQVYKYDLADIKKAVAKRIKHYDERIADLIKQIESCERIYMELRELYAAFMERAKEIDSEYHSGTFTHIITETIKSRYPYA